MKKSRYNMFWSLEDGTRIAFNCMTCALAEINDDFMDVLNNIENLDYNNLDEKTKTLVDNMLEGNYILKDNIDELKLIKYRHLNGKFSNEGLGLTIAPTLACNFACPYCYESPKTGFITEEVQKSILDMVEEAAKRRKDISTTWYGGEPLVAKDIIFDLSEKIIKICKEYDAPYSSYIVTNGYLITDEIIEKFKEYQISGAQVTIDGPPDIHNSRRKLRGSDKETFNIILDNVKKLKKNGMRVTIRINIDRTNVDRIEELLDIIEANNLKDVMISLGHVTAYTEACMSVSEACLNTEEYAKKNVKYQEILHSRGFNVQGYPYYPGIKANYCCADSSSSFVLDPEGYMYKCWNDVGNTERAVGQITKVKEAPNEDMYMRNVDYILWSPFNHEKCIECNLLPICMGGCPFNGERNSMDPDCEKWKYNLEDVLKLTYLQRKDLDESAACSICSCS